MAARSVVGASALCAVLWTACYASPWWFAPARDAGLAWNRAVGALWGLTTEFGPSAIGARLLLIAFACVVARFVLLERRLGIALLGVALLVASCIALVPLVDAFVSNVPKHFAGLSTWFALVPLALVAMGCASSSRAEPQVDPRATRSSWIALVGACLALVAALHAHVVKPAASPRVLFYAVNEGEILDWRKPRYGDYGAYSLGLFGLLPDQLVADGYQVDHLYEPITPQRLAGVDALVTINANTAWAEDELLAVWTFVHEGGSLLVLGDHTDVEGTMRSQNDLLAPVGIEFRFDSALPTHPVGWARAALANHPVHARVESAERLRIGVGASLELGRSGALPLVVGRHGFADFGDVDASERAFLGDYVYQPGEQLGDCVLAAWSRLGAGVVAVYGDTSGFQNPALEFTYDPWIHDLFSWLTSETAFDLGYAGSIAAGLVFLAGALASVVLARAQAAPLAGLVLMMGAVVVASRELAARWQLRKPVGAPQVLIDSSHLPRIELGADADLSLDGFRNCALRSGHRVATLNEFSEERLARAHVLLVVAPAQAYSSSEVLALSRFMEQGGFVIACASYPHSAPLAGLLDTVGLTVLPRPIGPIPLRREDDRVRSQVEYPGAWEVGVTRAPQSEAPWVYGEYRGTPLSMLARRGRGGLFLVGDSAFFGAGNLETLENYSEPNMLFLRALLSDLAELRQQDAPQ